MIQGKNEEFGPEFFSFRVTPKSFIQLWKIYNHKEQAKWTLSHKPYSLHFLSLLIPPTSTIIWFRVQQDQHPSPMSCFYSQVMGRFGAFSIKSPLLSLSSSIRCPKHKHLATPLQIASITFSPDTSWGNILLLSAKKQTPSVLFLQISFQNLYQPDHSTQPRILFPSRRVAVCSPKMWAQFKNTREQVFQEMRGPCSGSCQWQWDWKVKADVTSVK